MNVAIRKTGIVQDAARLSKVSARNARPNPKYDRIRVCDQLREFVTNGQFRPGTRMLASEIAEMLLVSITPVREALIQLGAERLIDFRPRQGFFTKIPGLNELTDVYDTLEVLINNALRRNWLQISHERSHVPKLSFSPIEEPWSVPKAYAYALSVEKFYEAITKSPDSDLSSTITRNLLDRSRYMRFLDLEILAHAKEAAEELEHFLRHVSKGDLEGAQESLKIHLARRREQLPHLVQESIVRWYMTH